MKRIPLRIVDDDRFPQGSPEWMMNRLEWAEMVRNVVRRPLDPQRGADIDEMRRGIRILDAVDEAVKQDPRVLELEDADWEHLKTKTQAMQWAIIDRRIIVFVDDVMDASDKVTLNAQFDGIVKEVPAA